MKNLVNKTTFIVLVLALQLLRTSTAEKDFVTLDVNNEISVDERSNQTFKSDNSDKKLNNILNEKESGTSAPKQSFSNLLEYVNILIKKHQTTVMASEKSNATITDSNATNFTKVNCLMNKDFGPVEIVNYTKLMEVLLVDSGTNNRSRNSKEDKALPGKCLLIMFYARWCIFSSQAAPHFNAIPRFYPNLKVIAIDAMKYQILNTQYGIVGVPTLMLVHNSKPVAKFNDTVYTLETFSKFISHLTNLQPNESLFVTSADFSGPLSSTPSDEIDYCLVMSWTFIAACIVYFLTQSQWWRQFIELVQNTWRESNAQHEHVD